MVYEGMACLKMYKNYLCTDNIESSSEGTFIYNSAPVSHNALRPLAHTLYVKNVGTHRAYDVNARIVETDQLVNARLDIDGVIIMPKQIVKLILTGTFEGTNKNNKTIIALDYSNV